VEFQHHYPALALAYRLHGFDPFDLTPPTHETQTFRSELARLDIIRWQFWSLGILAIGLASLFHPYGLAGGQRLIAAVVHWVCVLAVPGIVFVITRISAK
jgi:hypothetical protein